MGVDVIYGRGLFRWQAFSEIELNDPLMNAFVCASNRIALMLMIMKATDSWQGSLLIAGSGVTFSLCNM
jgi:hypothetical protein